MTRFSAISALRSLATALAISIVTVMSNPGTASSQFYPPGFYDVSPQELAGPPGSLILLEQYLGAPEGAAAYRILYRSIGLQGQPIAVSGVVLIPATPVPPGGRRIVAWAHPTTGVARDCAPSMYPSVFRNIPGLRAMLDRGFIVTATDYPGLGTVGPHPYLIGVSEGRAVLDSVRAARLVPGAAAANSFIAWGHSQGGHAAMWTATIARRYAPELQMRGVAAAAPASELARLFDRDSNEFTGKVLTAMTIWSWSQVFGYPTDNLVAPMAVASYQTVAQTCSESIISSIAGLLAESMLQSDFPRLNPTEIEPWRTQIRRNTLSGAHLSVPVFMAQGLADTVVWPQITEDYVRRLCRNGNAVRLVLVPGASHTVIAKETAPMTVEWMASRFAGAPAPNNCRSMPPRISQAGTRGPA